ncbi:MAG: LytTR family transcriptional regulator DNA-binding domain-containing protein [Clostridiales bacterium]|nr:LytTR family transcriptional regulator DNA-binding domain-containing protein [Clostridiales bacterium]
MKIVIDEGAEFDDVEVVIKCKKCDGEVLALLARIKAENDRLLGTIDDKSYIIDEHDVLYFESVDKKCFIYTSEQVYETVFRLYELEDMFRHKGFFRSTKSTIVNIAKIKSIQPSFNSVLNLEMENGEKLAVSRQFAPILKEKLGRSLR